MTELTGYDELMMHPPTYFAQASHKLYLLQKHVSLDANLHVNVAIVVIIERESVFT